MSSLRLQRGLLGRDVWAIRIVKSKNAKLHFSKRDAKTYFDLLRVPCGMRLFFGRPRVNLGRLAESLQKPIDDLRVYLDDCEAQNLRSAIVRYACRCHLADGI